jgi:hypothetical protein
MITNNELEREFREISVTRFWKIYSETLEKDRNLLARQLERSATISTPVTRGEIWQSQIATIDRLMGLPYKIIGYVGDNPSDDGTPNL